MTGHVATLPCDVAFITVHVSGCCCFSDINISQGGDATRLRRDGIFYTLFFYKFTAQSVSKIILKLGQYMAKLEAKI